MRSILIVMALALGAAVNPAPATAVSKQAVQKQAGKPLVIAHRGGAGLAPENTMVAFWNAARIGADMIEVDLHVTADHQLIATHDDLVPSWCSGPYRLTAWWLLTMAQVNQINCGGARPPTFDEVLTVLGAHPRLGVMVETKSSGTTAAYNRDMTLLILQAAARHKVTARTVLQSFDYRTFSHAEVRTGGLRLAPLAFRATAETLAGVAAWQVSVYGPEYHGLLGNPGLVGAAHQRGLAVWCWTPNSAGELQRLINMGVDGIITDRPDVLLRLTGR